MSAPAGWDDKSWSDVLLAEEDLRAWLARLRQLIGVEDADADAIEQAFGNIEELAKHGSMAASWCKS